MCGFMALRKINTRAVIPKPLSGNGRSNALNGKARKRMYISISIMTRRDMPPIMLFY
jgi:hypothetical protein